MVLELGLDGKFTARSTGRKENRGLLEGYKVPVEVKYGCSVLMNLPAAGRRDHRAPAQASKGREMGRALAAMAGAPREKLRTTPCKVGA